MLKEDSEKLRRTRMKEKHDKNLPQEMLEETTAILTVNKEVLPCRETSKCLEHTSTLTKVWGQRQGAELSGRRGI